MQINIDQAILKRLERMTEKEQSNLTDKHSKQNKQDSGEQKILEEANVIELWHLPSKRGSLCERTVIDVENQKVLLTTKITTNPFKLFGYASHATSVGIKK
jgi:hypothetical protein